jgi:hypothetical protein
LKALVVFFNNCVVEMLFSSEIKKISLATFECEVQVMMKLTKLSIAISDLTLWKASNGKGSINLFLAP